MSDCGLHCSGRTDYRVNLKIYMRKELIDMRKTVEEIVKHENYKCESLTEYEKELQNLREKLEELEIKERIKTVQLTALQKTARILRKVLKKPDVA